MKHKQVPAHVITILSAAATSGNELRLTGQLDRKAYTEVNAVIEAVGGKWNKKAKAHLFDIDAADAVDQIITTGEVLLKKTVQQEYGYFPTPIAIVKQMIERAGIKPGMTVLEPEAGQGAIVLPMVEAGAKVHCIEVLSENAHQLRQKTGIEALIADFLAVKPFESYDAVVMNPPFAKQADIRHVLHAIQFVKPGGVLVAIMGGGIRFRSDRRTAAFNQLLELADAVVEELPQGSFKESGTMVNTVMVTMDITQTVADAARKAAEQW